MAEKNGDEHILNYLSSGNLDRYKLAEKGLSNSSKEQSEQEKFFDNGLDFNAWQLKTEYPKEYGKIITKDVALSNLRTKEHFNKAFVNLRLANYLGNRKTKTYVGYKVITDGNEDGYEIENKNFDEVIAIIPEEEKILSIKKLYSEKKTFPKTVHNKLSTAYTLLSMSRGIMGKASNDLNTVNQTQTRTLRDETKREGFSLFKKGGSSWSSKEKEKNW